MSPITKYYDPNSLSEEQKRKINDLRARVKGEAEKSPALQAWLTDITLLRYLRARSWDLGRAEEMLTATLAWRETIKPEEIRWETIEAEAKTGKLFNMELQDNEGRHVLVMRPACENTSSHEGQIRNLIYMMETTCFQADEDESVQITILQDFVGYSLRNAPPMKTTRETLAILQNHYPERLKASLMYRAPSMFSMLWRGISPFIDPVTYKKIIFLEKGSKEKEAMGKYFDMEHLEPAFGGSGPPAFSLEEYAARMKSIDARRCVAVSQ
mmetsp:Transcript_40396/g.114370  ORF Transcript_40396/g.114370 Transcript_40396/m.114370 type:complete len:269 (-) Transcript_40396:1339-2145(-)